MLRLLGLVIAIGFADSLNPSTVGPSLFLASGDSPRRSVLQFAAGTFVVNLLGGLVLTLGPGAAIIALVPRPGATVRYALETAAGAAMLIGGTVLWRRRERLAHRQTSTKEHPKRRSPALMGATIAAIELPTAFPYFAAIIAIVGSGLNVVQELVLVVVYNACFILPLIGIVVVLAVSGERAVETLIRVRAYFRDHWPVIVAVLALGAGVIVMVLGVTGLTSLTGGRLGRLSRHFRHAVT